MRSSHIDKRPSALDCIQTLLNHLKQNHKEDKVLLKKLAKDCNKKIVFSQNFDLIKSDTDLLDKSNSISDSHLFLSLSSSDNSLIERNSRDVMEFVNDEDLHYHISHNEYQDILKQKDIQINALSIENERIKKEKDNEIRKLREEIEKLKKNINSDLNEN